MDRVGRDAVDAPARAVDSSRDCSNTEPVTADRCFKDSLYGELAQFGEVAEAPKHELPRGRAIVASCRGPHCVVALDAVALLRERGFTAHRMAHGSGDWRARGAASASEARR